MKRRGHSPERFGGEDAGESRSQPGNADVAVSAGKSTGRGGWARSISRLLANARPLSIGTQAVQEHLAAAPPTLEAGVGQTAAIPRRLPRIPGVDALEIWARGGMGIVYRGRDMKLDRPVAVKIIWPSTAGCERACQRAAREALVLARISHANVVMVHAAGDVDGSPYLVMEWVDGPSLHDRMARGLPSARQAARIVRDLARAVAVVHEAGVIHRDIKPDNVLLAGQAADDWELCIPKLADFGLARPSEASQGITQEGMALGTPAYMAPEQTGLAEHLGPIGPAVDIHGLGGLLFTLLTNSPPYVAANATALLHRAARGDVTWPATARQFPRDLRAIIEMCLEREPARRYASATRLADDLQRFVDELPVQARPASAVRRLAMSVRRRPAVSAVIGLAVTALIGGIYQAVTIADARSRIERSEQIAAATAGAASRSMGHLTGDLIEQMVRRSRPEDAGHIDFLRQIRTEFADWPQGPDPGEAIRFRVDGLQRVARLFADVSHFDDSLVCIDLTLAALDEASAHQRQDRWSLTERLSTLHMQRVFLYQLGRVSEATASARHSIACLEAAPADLPDREREIVRATLDLGMFLHEERQYAEGRLMIEKALTRMRMLRQARPDDVSLIEQEAHALFTAQLCAWNAERFDDCRRWCERLTAEIGGFLDEPQAASLAMPRRGFLTKMVCMGLTRLALLAEMDDQIDDAFVWTEQRRQRCLGLIADLPDGAIDPLQAELIDADLRLAELLCMKHRHDEAEGVLAQAAGQAEFMHAAEPGVWDHALLRARVCRRRAELALARGDMTAAADRFRTVIALMEPWSGTPACREKATELSAAAEAAVRVCVSD